MRSPGVNDNAFPERAHLYLHDSSLHLGVLHRHHTAWRYEGAKAILNVPVEAHHAAARLLPRAACADACMHGK